MGRRPARDRCELVKFAATDGVELSGLLFEPQRRTRRAAVFLHGTGGASIFESNRTNLLARELTSRGIAWLPFNNRGALLVRWLRGTRRATRGGMAYERIRDCVHDIDGVARFLRSRGYRELFLIGHSTGANKIAVYDSIKRRNPFRKYVLLAGGDDTGLFYRDLGPTRFQRALERARSLIKANRGDDLVPRSITPMMLSWRSFYDMANPNGDYNVFPFLEVMRNVRLSRKPRFRHIRAIRKPSLYVYGDRDEYCYDDVAGCVRVLSENVGANAEIVVMENANHGFSGCERDLGSLIGEWLRQ
jgi:pimeloyl-ACP methyl ester carboxylesterase